MHTSPLQSLFFFFNDTATTQIYPLSPHDALPIPSGPSLHGRGPWQSAGPAPLHAGRTEGKRLHPSQKKSSSPGYRPLDRKSTRLNSSHSQISYAVFCLKKKKQQQSDVAQTPICTA